MTLLATTTRVLQTNKRAYPKRKFNAGMPDIEKSAIKTLVYYQVLGCYPLTALELYRYLQKENDEQILPSFYDFLKVLEHDQGSSKTISGKNGFYFLKGNERFFQQRIFRQKIAIAKWRKIRRIALLLAGCPFLQGLIVSGSLSLGNTKPQSDIDLLIITTPGRIWTCRTFLSFFLQILGQRRHGNVIENKICLNHYIALDSLIVPLQNLSNAHLYSHLIPLTDYQNFKLFQEQNDWISKLIFSHPQIKQSCLRQISEKSILFKISTFLGRGLELLLSGFPGNLLERRLEAWQTRRIRKKTNRRAFKDEQLYLGKNMLLFHYPVCRNTEVMNKYRQKVQALKLS